MVHLTRSQAREIDRVAMQELGLPGIVLMENAARGIAARVLEALEEPTGPVAIVCGPGNNGGDGFAAARHLSNAGVEVRLHLTVPADRYDEGSDAAVNLAVARAMNLPLREDIEIEGCAGVLDALFGTGLERPVEGRFAEAVERINASGAVVVAVDTPSGLDADTGTVLGVAVRADVTATMVAPKVGFTRAEGPTHVGRVEVVDIGVPPSLVARVAGEAA
jgi:NAD(P)H-hydrate epimerase